ncbi:MAG: helix-turn-helix domain-containing protein [Phyllobacterium sp.]|uniref:helix-turn-helix domain-containing protein n=1 Tax=Phyllobacterium sp. TaxID=1871046 RepID=UPI0030F3563F
MSDETSPRFNSHFDADAAITLKDGNSPLQDRSKPVRAPHVQLDIAEEFIRDNVYNPITIVDIATATGLNIRALQRLFRKHHNATPNQMLASFRIATARTLILCGQATSVRHLTAKLHFSNPGRFSKLYRATYSHTPSEHIRARQDPAQR